MVLLNLITNSENIIYGKGNDKLTKASRAIDPSKIKKVAEED